MAALSRHLAHWPPGVPTSFDPRTTTLDDNLAVSAARVPEHPAIVFYGGTIRYARLHADVERLAGWLVAHGVGPGDRVLLDLHNSPQFVIGYYAILRAGGIVVPLNPMVKAGEFAYHAIDSGARLAITSQDLFAQGAGPALLAGLIDRCIVATYADAIDPPPGLPVPDFVRAARALPEAPGVIAWHACLEANLVAPAHGRHAHDIAALPYTSGTTGQPKGCMLTHANLDFTAAGSALWSQFDASTVVLGVLPMFHLTGMQSAMNSPIRLGATSVLMARWDRALAGRLIGEHRVTTWTAITTMLIDFLADPDLERHDLSSIRRLGGGGAAMPAALAAKLEQVFGRSYVEGYGLTETAAPSHVNPMHRPKAQCGGVPFIGTDSRVIDPASLAELGPGETGEIVTHGPQVFAGYWGREAATQEAFIAIDGKPFFRTGDLGHYDEDGYFFITDRLKRMINASGFKVWPAEVEAMLYGHPAVQEACVIAGRDPYRGETVKAVIVPRPGARATTSADDIIAWAREHMAAYKAPRIVTFVDALPRTASGKVFWRKLQEDEDAGAH